MNFDWLTEDLKALDWKELPSDPEKWRSRLTGQSPSAERIEEARRQFAELGMDSLRSWLIHYLRQDVLMTALGFRELRATFKQIFGVCLIDTGKHTIASLASYASQIFLYRHKRPAMYSPLNVLLYSSLRRGLRGGICQVFNAQSGRDTDFSTSVRLFRELEKWKSDGRPGDPVEELQRQLEKSKTPRRSPLKERFSPGVGMQRPSAESSDDYIQKYLRGNNAPTVADCEPGQWIFYKDIVSLYPTA